MTFAFRRVTDSTPLVVAFGYERGVRDVAKRRLAGVATVRFMDRSDTLARARLDIIPSVFLFRLESADNDDVLALMQRARREWPNVPILLASSVPDRRSASNVMAAVRAGPVRLVLDDTDDVGHAVREAIEDGDIAPACADTARVIAAYVPSAAKPVFHYCIMNVRRPLTVVDVARAVGVHPRSLHRRLSALGLPSPSSSISWSRLFVAVHLMNDASRSVEHVALHLRFSSGSALRNMLKRYSGLTPSELRRPEGLSRIATIFEAARV
jgi:AraC-like DNA-binding protein